MRFTDSRVPDPRLDELFGRRQRWQRYLDVEAALALAQGELGVVPAVSASAIAEAARLELLNLARVEAEVARTSHPLMALIVELNRVVGDEHGGWVHWGATTQNITQTGDALMLRDAHEIVVGLLREVVIAGAELAERGADLVMAGRTHGQQAVPITFGFKVAAWIDQLLRHLDRLEDVPDRLFTAMLGGAAGTFASLGDDGPKVQAAVARRLGLGSMAVPSRGIADPQAEFVSVLGLLAATGGAIAKELISLAETEFGEVSEPAPPGVIGSSTMPHKRNPQLCMDVVTISAQIRALVPLALEAMLHGHEVDGSYTAMMDDAIHRSCVLTGDLLVRLQVVLGGLELHPQRMRDNLNLTGMLTSEAVMLALGESLGRQRAHELVYEAAEAARTSGRSFADVLANDPRVSDHVDLPSLLDPANHVGLAPELARDAAARARERILRR